MKKIIFLGLLVLGLLFVPVVKAEWQRLVRVDNCARVRPGTFDASEVCIVYDKIEKVNCYVATFNANVSIDCIKAEK